MDAGNTVLLIEHSLDLISRSDWVIDLGPGGGVHGGELMYSGPMGPFVESGDSPTAEELRRHLKWEVLATAAAAS